MSSRVKACRSAICVASSGDTVKRKWWRSSSQRSAKALSSAASDCGIEHACVLPVSRDAFALQIGDVLGERRGRKALALVAHDARHDDDAPPGRARREGECRAAAAAEGGASFAAAGAAEVFTRVAGLLRGPHHLADKALRSAWRLCCRAGCALAGCAGRRRVWSSRSTRCATEAMALGSLKSLRNWRDAPATEAAANGQKA